VWLVLKFHDTWGEAKYQLSTAGIVMDTHRDPERPMESQKELGFFRYFRVLKNMERSSHKKSSASLPGFPVTAHHCLVTTAVTKCSSVTALDSSDISTLEDLKKHLTTRQLLRKSIACLRLHWSQACAATVAR
jgi:hypothetical protein